MKRKKRRKDLMKSKEKVNINLSYDFNFRKNEEITFKI